MQGRTAWRALQRAQVARLRQAMLNAHPDRGGTTAKFLKARQAYLRAA
jgi:hypothetical protein